MTRHTNWIQPLLLVLVFGWGCGADEAEPEPSIRPVRTLEVTPADTAQVRVFTGRAKAGTESRLSFPVPGTIKSLAARLGDRVEIGDRLVTLDATGFVLALQEAQAALAGMRAQASNARTHLDRIQTLGQAGAVSQAQLDSARTSAQAVDAQVEALTKRVQSAREHLKDTRLVAPFSGVVSAVLVEANENVRPAEPVLVLASTGDPEVVASVPSSLISEVEQEARVEVVFPGLAGTRLAGRVTEIGVATEGIGTTFPVTVQLIEPDPRIRSGMAVEVSFTFEVAKRGDAFLLPSTALAEDHSGRFVYLVTAGPETGIGAVSRRTVVIGDLTEDGVEVRDGIGAGDLVVVAGVSRVRDGQLVRLLDKQRGAL